ncbi:MAG: hypothetical protein M1383_05705 [Patescibacteria group bacterium]|nr:hypothetical protein [Patescibacteria group bacterium]
MNRKNDQKNIRKLYRQGSTSMAVTLPIEMVADLKWRERQKVKVSKVRGGILIKDWKK